MQITNTEDSTDGLSQQTDTVSEQRPDHLDKAEEIGGFTGPEPTRYGDWEKNGRCIDF